MNVRLQTWFPRYIQICLNGREWLRRSLERKQISFEAHGRRFRGLDPTGKDCEMLQLIGSTEFKISGLTNKMLRRKLSNAKFGSGKTDKQLSAKISRYLAASTDNLMQMAAYFLVFYDKIVSVRR